MNPSMFKGFMRYCAHFLLFISVMLCVLSYWKDNVILYPFMSLLSLYRLCYGISIYLYIHVLDMV